MEKSGLPFVFMILGVVLFSNISGELGIAKAADSNVVFSLSIAVCAAGI